MTITDNGATMQLTDVSGRLTSLKAPIEQILRLAAQSNVEQVRVGKGAAFGGAPWAPMAASTVKSGRDPETLLVDSGDLLRSLAPGSNMIVQDFEGSLGTDVFYAPFQAFGTSRGIPPRHFLEWYDEQEGVYDQVMLDYIHGAAA